MNTNSFWISSTARTDSMWLFNVTKEIETINFEFKVLISEFKF